MPKRSSSGRTGPCTGRNGAGERASSWSIYGRRRGRDLHAGRVAGGDVTNGPTWLFGAMRPSSRTRKDPSPTHRSGGERMVTTHTTTKLTAADPVMRLVHRAPVWVHLDTTLRGCARVMNEESIGAVLVKGYHDPEIGRAHV